MNRKWIAGLLLLLVVIIAGCGQKPQAAPNGSNESPDQVVQNPVTAAPDTGTDSNQTVDATDDTNKDNAVPDEIKQSIKVYFTDNDLMELQSAERQITFVDESQKYEKAFGALQTPEQGKISLWQKVVLKSAAFSNGQVTVDITLPDEARLGAGGESLAIDALKQTMFQFDEVKQLELTVDGQQVDTLMGHVELEHPIKK
ncbi:Sporulation and spore germination [Fontibacillus panacisegetis]|uniref:Sporulation and spore germination n=1 Tax=Fontibacillus panacisegetis TaxID=670482 RepID=A0A1G7KWB9_9BACL|nr:GerMN domain-containing protein [Fontibacillus panacisegetis]SDF41376.1 Sporulation and spore germination [Fontibacillus panacisegetis]